MFRRNSSIVAMQRKDPQRRESLIRTYERGIPSATQRVYDERVELVPTQAFAEETVLFPRARRLRLDGEPPTAGTEREHEQVNEPMRAMEGLPPDDPRFDALASALFALLREDAPGDRLRRLFAGRREHAMQEHGGDA